MANITGDSGPNTLNGTEEADLIDGKAGDDTLLGNGGNDTLIAGIGYDTVVGGEGGDRLYFGADLSNADYINGGPGKDTLYLQGDYSSALVIGAGVLNNIEMIVLMSGADPYFGDTAGNAYTYNFRTSDANVGAGQVLGVDFSQLGRQEHVIFGGAAETDGSFVFYGGFGDDTLAGGGGNDVFNFGTGRWDQIDDTVNGGGGSDTLNINLAPGTNSLTFRPNQLASIETVNLLGTGATGTHSVTVLANNIANGGTMAVDASSFGLGEKFVFDGSAVSGAGVSVVGTQNDDWICGGAGNDVLLGGVGNDTLIAGKGIDTLGGGDGDDLLYLGANLTDADYVNGNAGYDRLLLQGTFSAVVSGNVVVGIEEIDVLGSSDTRYGAAATSATSQIFLSDTAVAAHQTLIVDARSMGAGDTLLFDGRSETDGNLIAYGGAGNDTIVAGRNAVFWGGAGSDTMQGASTYVYSSVGDSTPAAADDLTWSGGEVIDLSRIDANVTTAADDAFTPIGSAEFSHTPGELRYDQYQHSPSPSGPGYWLIQGDVDGDGVADLAIYATTLFPELHQFAPSDFIL